MKRLSFLTILTSLFLLFSDASAEKQSYRESIKGLDPLDLSKVDPKIAGILRKYYQFTFGDSLSWEAVESLRIEGEFYAHEQTLKFFAYKKKPDSSKVILDLGNGGQLIYAYDGRDAWQLNTLDPDGKPASMPEGEALNFIREATVGGYLIYPQVKGKQFEFVGTSLIEGDRVYELKTTLPDGQVIRSFLDMTSFAELYQITINNLNQNQELKLYSDFREVDGMRIPFSTTLKVDDEVIYRSSIVNLDSNRGVMPWVFSRSHPSNSVDGNANSEASSSSLSLEPVTGSSFSIQETDIWSTTSGVVGSAFQIESAGSGEGQKRLEMDDLRQELEDSKTSEE